MISSLKNNYSIDFLQRNLFSFRDNVDDSEYHFKIGMSMLNLGYLKEADTAFKYAYRKKQKQLYLLLQIITLIQAQKYDDAIILNKKINLDNLNLNELVLLMESRNRLLLDNQKLNKYIKTKFVTNIDQKVLLIYAFILCNKKTKAYNIIKSISYREFSSITDYMEVLKDLYKLRIPNNILLDIFNKIPIQNIPESDVLSFLKTIVSLKIFSFLNNNEKKVILNYFIKKFNNNNNILSFIYSTLFDDTKNVKYIEYLKNIIKKESIEYALITIVYYEFDNFEKADHLYLKDKLEKLISIDQKNMLYKKLYFEFLKQLGFINQANEINKSAILFKQIEERKVFKLIQVFHNFYIHEYCPFCLTIKNDCFFCNNSKNPPIIKTIAFNTSPREIYAENIISYKTELDEESMSKLLNWAPMNVASPLIGTYLKKLGAYSTQKEFPDVLVEGQIYVFIKLKESSFKRLAKEGYTLNQIDPLLNILTKHQKFRITTDFKEINKKIDENNLPISSSDFIIEIIRAIKKT